MPFPLEQSKLTLDELIQREGKLKVFVISDIPLYNEAASSVFTTEFLESTILRKIEARRLIENNVEEVPDIIVYNLSGESFNEYHQLDLMTKLGLKFRYSTLFVTTSVRWYIRNFGEQNDLALYAIWDKLVEGRAFPFITRMRRMAYPEAGVEELSRRIFRGELVMLLHSSLNRSTLKMIYDLRGYRST